jgi:hypothetical protein
MKRTQAAVAMMLLALALAWPLGAAPDEAADKAEQAARREAMLSAGRAAFCRVHFFFKRPSDAKEPGMEQFEDGSFDLFATLPYEQLINHHESLVMPGLLLDDAGHVLVGDVQLELKYIDRIEVVAPDGARYPAQLDRLLDRATGVMLTISEPLKNWKAPVFAAPAVFDDANPARVVMLHRSGRNWFLALGAAGMDYPYEPDGTALKRFSGGLQAMSWVEQLASSSFQSSQEDTMTELLTGTAQPMLLCDEKGRPVGALTTGFLPDPDQKLGDWEQQRLLAGPGIRFDDLRALGEKCNEELSRKAYKCVIQYRHEEGAEGSGGRVRFRGGMMSFSSSYGRGRAEGADRELFGLAVSDRDVFVPQAISRDELANVEKIEIVVGEKPQPAEFVAAFQDLAGFIVRLKDGALPAHASIAPHPAPERLRLFLTAALEEKAGKTHVEVKANRWLNESRGYKDLYYISPAHRLGGGGWILDRDLEILGVFAGQRIVGEEIQNVGAGRRGWYSDSGRSRRRIFWTAELAPMLADPMAFADPQIRVKSEEEAKRLVWLGVESSPMTPELAKQLKVEKATKDGTVGLYVNLVYRNSPAERLGIKEADILVQIETAKQAGPIDLNAAAMSGDMFRFDWRQYADYRTVEEVGEAQPRWPIQLNYLTMLLQSIGEGEQIKLSWIHGAEAVSKDYRIELGPPNFLCAPKFKNKEIGLTVRDVTYEVRAALRLEDARSAVVVAKVERGSPAEVARIAPFELITAIDGAPIATAKGFGESIKAAREAGKKSVRLTVELLGNSRLADLDIAGASAPKEKAQDD